ncbi:MAG: hypothetical protein U1F43_07525 [Myxococcota bacterium]
MHRLLIAVVVALATAADPSSPTFAAPPEPAPSATEAAVAKALPLANAALARSYREFAATHDFAPKHPEPWVAAAEATSEPDGHGGWVVTWRHAAPAGFELEARVAVPARRPARVLGAWAVFSPE